MSTRLLDAAWLLGRIYRDHGNAASRAFASAAAKLSSEEIAQLRNHRARSAEVTRWLFAGMLDPAIEETTDAFNHFDVSSHLGRDGARGDQTTIRHVIEKADLCERARLAADLRYDPIIADVFNRSFRLEQMRRGRK